MGVRVREKNGSWWVFIHYKGGRKAKKIGDRRAAQEVAWNLQPRLALGLTGFNSSDSPTLQEYATGWLRTYATVYTKPRTVEFYEAILRRHILPTLGELRLSEFSREKVRTLLADRAAAGLARGSLAGRCRAQGHLQPRNRRRQDGPEPCSPAGALLPRPDGEEGSTCGGLHRAGAGADSGDCRARVS